MTAVADKPSFTIKGWHVLVSLILFFGIIIATDVAFVVLAYRTFSGQVASNPYEAGLAYNKTLAQKARQDALGWTASIGDEGGRLSVTISDPAGRPIEGLGVTATLERPATEQGRRVIKLTPDGAGRYGAPFASGGAWDVRVVAEGPGGDRFEAERRLVRP